MLISEILSVYKLLDKPRKPGKELVALFKKYGQKVVLKTVTEKKMSTEFVKIVIPGKNGKTKKGTVPTLGIIGRLGGVGARPKTVGFVSDGDGALAALSTALRLAVMKKNGDELEGDVIVATHVCTTAPTTPHEPVAFMGSPVELATMNAYEVDPKMDAVLSVDTSRGNKIINHNGFALSPTVKSGYILRMSDDLLSLMEQVTGKPPVTFPITTQDITPYGNGFYHFNSIMQPCTATQSPVVGVAITSISPVAGCSTGVSNVTQIDEVGRFLIEVAQRFGKGKATFVDNDEFVRIEKKYGDMKHLQKK